MYNTARNFWEKKYFHFTTVTKQKNLKYQRFIYELGNLTQFTESRVFF